MFEPPDRSVNSAEVFRIRPAKGKSPVLVHLRLPPFPDLLVHLRLPFSLPDLHLDAFPRAQDLALQIETSALLRIVEVKELLESLCDGLQVGFSRLWRLHVEDLASLIQRQAGGLERVPSGGVALARLSCIFRGGRGLLVSLHKGSSKHPGTRDDNLRENAMRLYSVSQISRCRTKYRTIARPE